MGTVENTMHQNRRIVVTTFTIASIFILLSSASADDWPMWRGPDRSGISTESGWFKPGTTLTTVWEHEVGEGYSAVSVVGKCLYTMGNVKNNDEVVCLDTDSGAVVWKFTYPCKGDSYAGPRATPTVEGNRVYTFSRNGDLLCLDAATGKSVWSRELNGKIAASPGWGFASSPTIYKNTIIVNAGEHGMAFDKATGTTIWESEKSGASYATPVLYRAGDRDGVAIFAAKAINGVVAATGELLWKYNWKTDYDVHAATPVFIADDRVFISSGYDRGSALLRIGKGGIEKIWENKNLCSHFSSPILYKGMLYGINGNTGNGETRCIDPANGTVKWRTRDPGFGSLMLADGKLIILSERGLLVIAEAAPGEYKEIFRKQILNETCWTVPVLANGNIYCRNHPGKLLCLRFK